MNKRDRGIVNLVKFELMDLCTAKEQGGFLDNIDKVLGIIDRLNEHLTEIMEAGKPFIRFHSLILHVSDENIALTVPPPDEHTDKVTYKEWSRLAQVLKEVKDD